jgi:uncharacterized protein (TIGR03435 family)
MRGTIAGFVLCLTAAAQTSDELPSFDVASVKPNNDVTDKLSINLGSVRHGEVTLGNTNMNDCIRFAYELSSNEQISGPLWMGDYKFRFDIIAKAPPDTPHEKMLLMLQRLLAERFHLKLHREPKAIAHYEIELGKDGPKMPPSPEEPPSRLVGYNRGLLNYRHIPLGTFAVLLSRQLKQPVLDRTGLRGFYDFKIEWLPDDLPSGPPASADMETRPDLFRAMQSQLGLKLIASKAPIDVLVVDHVDQVPVGN